MVFVKIPGDAGINDMFENFGANRGEGYRSIVFGLVLTVAPFLCNTKMLAIRQSLGTTPEDRDWLNRNVRTAAISSFSSLMIRGDSSSGPVDLLTSILDNRL